MRGIPSEAGGRWAPGKARRAAGGLAWAVGVALASLLSSLEMDKRADRSSLGSCLEEVGSGRKDGGPLLPSSLLGFIWVREVGRTVWI